MVIASERGGLLSKVYDNPKYDAAFDRCIDIMAKLMQKYGEQVLEQQEKKISIVPSEQLDKQKDCTLDHAA